MSRRRLTVSAIDDFYAQQPAKECPPSGLESSTNCSWTGVLFLAICPSQSSEELPRAPLSPLLFIFFMEPLIARLRAGAVGVELAPETFIRCLLFADDICLTASSLEDLQRMLNICSDWAVEAAMIFNTSKSHLLHLRGQSPDPNVALLLSGEVLAWKSEVVYLGVPIRRSRGASNALPLELPRAWAALHKAGLALSPHAPIPLEAQLRLINSDVLAGVMYPAAVHDLDYVRIDAFVNSLLRRLTGCAAGTSATFLRCELGLLPARFLAHRRMIQYWLHINRDAWFAGLLPSFHGQGPIRRLRNVADEYGLAETTEVFESVDGCEAYPISKESWQNRVRQAVDDKAVKYLESRALARGLPGPERALRKNGRLKLVPRPYVGEGGELAKYGVVFRQCVVSTRFEPWDRRSLKACHHCHSDSTYGDLAHLLSCAPAIDALSISSRSLLAGTTVPGTGQDPAKVLSDALARGTRRVSMPRLRLLTPEGGRDWILGARWKKRKMRNASVPEGSLKPALTLLKELFKLACQEA
jgi:hypothetical protein